MTTRSMLALVREPLLRLGFRKRSGPIFTTELAPDVLGWLGLNTATGHEPAGSVEVNPVVGVRHQVVERTIARLVGEAFHPYLPPTIRTSIGYVMPESTYTAWYIADGGPPSEVDDLVRAVERHGLAYMQEHTTLSAVGEAAERGDATAPEYQLPVLRLLLGRATAARNGLAADVEGLGDRRDPGAERLRAFARAFAAEAGEQA